MEFLIGGGGRRSRDLNAVYFFCKSRLARFRSGHERVQAALYLHKSFFASAVVVFGLPPHARLLGARLIFHQKSSRLMPANIHKRIWAQKKRGSRTHRILRSSLGIQRGFYATEENIRVVGECGPCAVKGRCEGRKCGLCRRTLQRRLRRRKTP